MVPCLWLDFCLHVIVSHTALSLKHANYLSLCLSHSLSPSPDPYPGYVDNPNPFEVRIQAEPDTRDGYWEHAIITVTWPPASSECTCTCTCTECTSLHITSRVAQTVFQAYTTLVSREKPLEVFHQLRATRLLFRLPWAG